MLNSVQFPVKVLKLPNPVFLSCKGGEMRTSMLGPSLLILQAMLYCSVVIFNAIFQECLEVTDQRKELIVSLRTA